MEPVLVVLVVVVVVVSLGFGVLNGVHDAGDVIAAPVATGAVSQGWAVVAAAGLTAVGGVLGTGVAQTIGEGVVSPAPGAAGLVLVLAALVGAVAWGSLTWWLGMPSSSTHALVGGLAGAGVAAGDTVRWPLLMTRVLLPLVLAPPAAFLAAAGLAVGVAWAFRHAAPGRAHRRLRNAQLLASAGVALGHGLQDAQRTAAVLLLTLVAGGLLPRGSAVPLWLVLAAAGALALGTATGGWRIVRTLGRRVTRLDPPSGFAAEATTAGVLCVAAAGLGVPVSTTYSLTAALAGAGTAWRPGAVRWRVVRRIAVFWVLTAPASALVAATVVAATMPFVS